MTKSKTYQKPKATHPWRQYRNRTVEVEVEIEVEVQKIIPVKDYLNDLVANWEQIEVTTSLPQLGRRTYTLSQLPQAKVAAYIAGVLKRNYVQKQIR